MRAVVLGDDHVPVARDRARSRGPARARCWSACARSGSAGRTSRSSPAAAPSPAPCSGHEVAGDVLDGALPRGHARRGRPPRRLRRVRALPGRPRDDLPRVRGLRPAARRVRRAARRVRGARRGHRAAAARRRWRTQSGALVEPLACVVRGAEGCRRAAASWSAAARSASCSAACCAPAATACVVLEPGRRTGCWPRSSDAERPAPPRTTSSTSRRHARPPGSTTRCALLRPGGTCLLFAAEPEPRPVDLDRVYRIGARAARLPLGDARRTARAALELIAQRQPCA